MSPLGARLLCAVLVLLFFGCEPKEQDFKPQKEHDATTQRILNFKDGVVEKSANEGNIHIDSLVWYAENECLSPDDMFFLLSNMAEIILENQPDDLFDDYVPFNIEVFTAEGLRNKAIDHGEHWYKYDLGKKHYSELQKATPVLMSVD